MDFKEILDLSPEENYKKALVHKQIFKEWLSKQETRDFPLSIDTNLCKNKNKYLMHIIQSANLYYEKSVSLLCDEYDITPLPSSTEEFIAFIKTTSEQNLPYSIYYLGILQRRGIVHTNKNPNDYFIDAILLGCHIAILAISEVYSKCNDSRKKVGITLYQLHINLGCTSPMLELAHIYERGKIVEKDIKKSLELYEMAAKKGSKEANSYLAYKFAFGINVERNINKAAELYYEAKEYGACADYLFASVVEGNFNSRLYKILAKLNLENIKEGIYEKFIKKNVLKVIKHLYTSQIDLLDAHFKYQPGGDGFLEAKKDFHYRIDQI